MPSRKNTKKQIKKAAEEIPELIARDMEKEEQVDDVLGQIYGEKEQKHLRIPDVADSKRRTLWSGVIGVTLVIFIMWIWNVSAMVHDVMAVKDTKPAPWADAQSEFSYIMGTLKDQEVETLDSVFEDGMQKVAEEEAKDKALDNAMEVLAQKVWSEGQKAATSTTSTLLDSIDNTTSTPILSTSTTSTVHQ